MTRIILLYYSVGLMFRILVFVSIFAAMLGGAGPSSAHSAEATDAAFGILLSRPGTKPKEGQWIIPDKYAGEFTSEPELIDRLRQLKKQGADFNALRHRGTLLAHAIRSGLDRTALWLLRNGADPKHVLFDTSTTAYDLARTYQRPVVLKVLESDYGFSSLKPPPVATNATAAALKPAIPRSKVDEAAALMTSSYPDKAQQQAWQRFASTLSEAEFAAVFKDGTHLESLIRLTHNDDGALEKALARLPLAVLRQNAQQIADLLADISYVSYTGNSVISYTPAARAWPILWQRIEQPLRYDSRPDLAERIPPNFWPALFASGYNQQDAALTGCLLASVDLAGFKKLWPDFQRFFSNARQAAPALVLGKFLPSFDPQSCYYGSSPEQTIAKLTFLKQQGIQAKVSGLGKVRLANEENPALTAMVNQWVSTTLSPPQLIQVAPRCELVLNEAWLAALIKKPVIGWGIPAERVRVIEVPDHARCGLVVSGSSFLDYPQVSDNFDYGPSREGWPSCPDSPDDSEIWIENAGSIHTVKTAFETRGALIDGQVKDVQSGKMYLLRSGRYGTMCLPFWTLPEPYEWQAGVLHPAKDAQRIGRLLRDQCEELADNQGLECRGFLEVPDSEGEPPQGEAVLAALHQGKGVSLHSLIDALGVERRQAYAAAIAARDRTAHRTLVAAGIPSHWTVAEIVSLSQSGLPLEEKRQRIALLFSIKDQLMLALNSKRYDLPEALLTWLPRQDWGPVWRVIGREPDIWLNAAGSLRHMATQVGREDLLCDIDRAQGFLCGGGIELQ
jgi:hypothetical protein